MSGFLLHTNVVPELTREAPDSQVVAFLAAQDDLWLPTIVLHELEFGLNLLPPGRRRNRIRAALSALIMEYGDRVLPPAQSAKRGMTFSANSSSEVMIWSRS